MTDLEKVNAELCKYRHAILSFRAEETENGVELVISLLSPGPGVLIYRAPVHTRDIAHPQFPWTFQRYVYDCMHDYLVDLFECTPQMKEETA